MNKKIEKPRVVAIKLTDKAMKGLVGGGPVFPAPKPPDPTPLPLPA